MINNGPLLCSLQRNNEFQLKKKKIWVTLLMCLIFLIFILLCFVLVSHLRIASCSNIAFFMILFRLKCSFDRLYFDEWQFLVQNYRAKITVEKKASKQNDISFGARKSEFRIASNFGDGLLDDDILTPFIK